MHYTGAQTMLNLKKMILSNHDECQQTNKHPNQQTNKQTNTGDL